jgi:dTDP-4-amino-4,6-dideoxygalactose transaminase
MPRINVTKSFLPPIEEYEYYLNQIWESNWLTNQGPILKEFEKNTQRFLGVNNLHYVTNGTIALQLALRALDITDAEVITTPFSYVATTSSIMWEGSRPVFVDIEPQTLCIDPTKIENAITKKTMAIMPVHVFGNPCDIEKINAIAKKHNLKVIYDAAHAFGVKYNGKSLLSFGDISTCSFHSTKVFHTVEGGAVIARDTEISKKLELIKAFGHEGDEHYMLGINAKASEFHAAMGLCNLKHIDKIITERKALTELYDRLLPNSLQRPIIRENTTANFAYYPVLFETEKQLLLAFKKLAAKQIFPRRYFYPSLNKLDYIKGNDCPVSENIAPRIACLPLYAGLGKKVVEEIAKTLHEL